MILPLCDTEENTTATIRSIQGTALALRILELGFTPGTPIKTLLHNKRGGCCAYLIKGAVIVLRNEDARNINVSL